MNRYRKVSEVTKKWPELIQGTVSEVTKKPRRPVMASLTPLEDGCFQLEGNIDKKAVPTLVESGWKQLAATKSRTLVIDFSDRGHRDSAAGGAAGVDAPGRRRPDHSLRQFSARNFAPGHVCGLTRPFEILACYREWWSGAIVPYHV